MNFSSRRKAVGLTQEEVAKTLGIDQSTVALWEKGKTKPRAQLLPKIAALYQCSIDELLSDNETSIPTTTTTTPQA